MNNRLPGINEVTLVVNEILDYSDPVYFFFIQKVVPLSIHFYTSDETFAVKIIKDFFAKNWKPRANLVHIQ